jgi:MFS family permease
VKDGFLFLGRERIPRISVILDSWFFLVGGILFTVISYIVYERLVPGGAGNEQGGGVQYLGFAYGSLGLGLATGGLLTGKYGGRIELRWLIPACFAGAAAFTLMLMFQRNEAGIYFSLAGLGYSAGGVVVCIETTLQRAVPDEIRGRVFALNSLLLNSVLLVSIFAGATLLKSDALTPNAMLAVAGIIATAGAVFAFFGYPPKGSLNTLHEAHAPGR